MLQQKIMIEKRIESQSIPIKTIHISPHAKQNSVLIAPVTHVPKSPTRYLRTSIHPQEASIPQWATSTHPIARVSSPPSVLNSISNTRRPDFIELGGSREKRSSLYRESEPVRRIDEPTQVLSRKILMLEGRVKELHLEKQTAVAELSEKLGRMQMENDKLVVLVHRYQTETKAGEFSDMNLEEMLSSQININLELREENEKLSAELKGQAERSNDLQSKLCLLQAQKDQKESHYEKQISLLSAQKQENVLHQRQLEAKMNKLEQMIAEMEQMKTQRQTAIQEMVQEKEKRILELQDQAFSLSSSNEQGQKYLAQLQCQIEALKQENGHLSEQLSGLRGKQECKKCKQLLHTVFRLNSQLNKK